ncbi:MAG: fused MFS/spermidine synthase [Acidobacteriia bacterium]|nr:fused MFS/spermidine synthase [Terriglobia bacterium]
MAAPSQVVLTGPSRGVRCALLLIGGTAVTAQIVLLRELLSLFQGNEFSIGVMLAVWLLGTAFGSGLLGRLTSGMKRDRQFVAGLQVVSAAALALAICVVRYSRVVVPAVPGEVLGPGRMFLTSVVALGIFCPISGLLFTVASRWYMQEIAASPAAATGYAYMLESLGAAGGGVLASFVLLPYLSTFQIAVLVAAASLLVAVWIATGPRPALTLTLLLLLCSALAWRSTPGWEAASLSRQWPGLQLVEAVTSRYGNLAVLDAGGTRSVAQSGVILFTSADLEAAEEAVHFALLQHPDPRAVLLVGGGVNGSAMQVMQHPSVERLDYVELDPRIVALAERHFPAEWARIRQDPRIHVHALDGRAFLRTTRQKFDVIILNLPEPRTAQLNRFYTREFFGEASAALNPGGVLGFQLPAAENYLNPVRAAFFQCIQQTLRQSFAEVRIIPGDTLHFLASNQPGRLTTDARLLAQRIQERHLRTAYVRDYFLSFRLTAERIADMDQQTAPLPGTPANRDFAPVAYYLDVAAWSTHFDRSYATPFSALTHVGFASLVAALAGATAFCMAVLAVLPRSRRVAAGAALCVATMGMTMLALEVFLLLGFQAVYGYVFHQLAVIIAGFMLGLAAGTWLARRGHPLTQASMLRRAIVIQLAAAAISLVLWAALFGLAEVRDPRYLPLITQAAFPLMAAVCGLVGGSQFPLASGSFFLSTDGRNAGALYAVDLVGSCVGALGVSVFLLPVFGLGRTAVLIALSNISAAAVAASALGAAGRRH